MKTVILCGGKGTRMGEASEQIPKPMMAVGEKPILWHIMKMYASHGFNDFILCLGYKGEKIREYFEKNNHENWKIHFVDTGEDTTKSQRIMAVKDLINEENFFLSYGDDLSDVDLNKLLKFHEYMGLTATLTAARLLSHFGIVEMTEENVITNFKEKPVLDHWMNGGFMVLNKKIFDHLQVGEFEDKVLPELAKKGNICAYKHKGEWKSMNTIKDNMELTEMWSEGKAFWKTWKE